MNSVLLSFILVSLALRYLLDVQPIWVFVAGAAAIGVLADWVRRATEQLAHRAGATIGGLLNVSFGNIAALVLALFVLSEAETQVVQAQITGSIIGTTLLFLGISALGSSWPESILMRYLAVGERAGEGPESTP
jgi:Ca2+:H+ antiporter